MPAVTLRHIRAIRQCAENGLTQTGAAALCGLTRKQVKYIARQYGPDYGIKFKASRAVLRAIYRSAGIRRHERDVARCAA